MSSILAKVGLTASASLIFSHCRSGIASIQPLARYFHSSQFWYNDNAASNARAREKYASDPQYRKRKIQTVRQRLIDDPDCREKNRQTNIKWRAKNRPEHVQNYLNDAKYRDSLKYERTRSDASRQREYAEFRENVNNLIAMIASVRWTGRKPSR